MPASRGADAGMRFVDDHEIWASAQEIGPPAVTLDVIEADDSEWIRRKDALGLRQLAFEADCRGGGDGNALNMELVRQLHAPLINEVWWAQHRDAVDVASVEEFAGDEPGFDGFTDPDIVGDQQA
jgi:hypothetical protein